MHLPERVLRQYGFVQMIPRHPSMHLQGDQSIEELDYRLIHFHAHVVQDVTPIESAGQCVEGYMEWFRLVSHPYIIQMLDHDRPTVVAPMRGADADDGQTHDDDDTKHFGKHFS